MYIDICCFDGDHLLGESATHPIELLATRLGCCFSSKAVAFRVVAPTHTRRQQPTRARSTEESRLMHQASKVESETFRSLEAFAFATASYLIVSLLITALASVYQRRFPARAI